MFHFKIIVYFLCCVLSIARSASLPYNVIIDTLDQEDDITPKTIDPTFYLYASKEEVHVFKYYTDLSEYKWFDGENKVRFIIHGWTDYYESGNWLELMKDTLLEISPDSYVILVDWSRGSKDWYWRSARATHQVAKAVASVLEQFEKYFGLDMRNVQCIGHSLGGQTCGFVGKEMKSRGKKIGVVSSMDPAGPNFRMQDPRLRVNHDDAYFVEIFHTNMARTALGGLGSVFQAGHVDYYFNGGQYQPGCAGQINVTYDLTFEQFNDAVTKQQSNQLLKIVDYLDCSHSRILDFYTVNFKKEGDCEPVAYQCASWEEFLAGHCTDCGDQNEKCRIVGFYPDQLLKHEMEPSKQGFYLLTEGQVPFCCEFKPNSELTTLLHNDQKLGKLASVSTLFLSKPTQPSKIHLNSIELNYLSNLKYKIRKHYSSVTCDQEIVAKSELDSIELC